MRIQVKGDEVKLYGPIWEGDGSYISNELERLEGSDPLIVRLHTPGGSVIDGNLIASTLKTLKRPIHFVVDGLAASMGAVLLAYGDKVSIRKNAFIMIHEPKGGVHGTAKDLRSVAEVLESMRNNFIDVFVAKTKKAKADVEKWLDGDNWFDALKAKTENLVDSIEDSVIPDKDLKALRNLKITADLKGFDDVIMRSFEFEDKNLDNNLKSNIEMKQALISAFGLTAVTAESSDTAIVDAVKKIVEDKDKQISDLQAKLDARIEAEKKAKSDAIEKLLAKAVSEGKITADEKDTYKAIGETNGVESLQAVLDKFGTRQPLSGSIAGNGNIQTIAGIPQGRENWDWDKWQKEDAKGLEGLKTSNFDAFNKLFKEKFGKDFKA